MLHKVLESAIRGDLDFTFLKVVIRKTGHDHAIEAQGNGTCRQEESHLKLSFICTGQFPENFYRDLSKSVPGKLVSESEYCQMDGLTHDGSEWEAERVLLDTTTSAHGVTATAQIRELKFKKQGTRTNFGVRYSIPGRYKFPAPGRVTETRSSGDTTVEKRFDRNLLKRRFGAIDFTLEQRDDHLIYEACTEIEPEGDFAAAALCALEFAFGRRLNWAICNEWEQSSVSFRVRPKVPDDSSHRLPPVVLDSPTHVNDFGALLERYTTRVMSHDSIAEVLNHWSWYSIESGSTPLTTFALVHAIAAEALLVAIGTSRPSANTDEFEELRKCIESRPLADNTKKRLLGLIGSAAKLGPKDVMIDMETAGKLRPEYRQSWDYVRNRLAHGAVVDSENFETILHHSHVVTSLFHRLVFEAIGYQGQYQDYATEGWPVALVVN